MFNTMKTALSIAIVLGTASAALAAETTSTHRHERVVTERHSGTVSNPRDAFGSETSGTRIRSERPEIEFQDRMQRDWN
jgi:hypothetical protein